jgi:hypothetical protein
MLLWFTAARVVVFGRTLTELKPGHRILLEAAFEQLPDDLPLDKSLVILGCQRTDLPMLRPNGTVSPIGLVDGLLRAQLLPKYHHGMRQSWHHPVKSVQKIQRSLYERLLKAVTEDSSELLGQALHTLQDSYTIGHTERENNADVFSPMVRTHYSPSKAHPFINPHDAPLDANGSLKPEAQAAVTATIAAIELWCRVRHFDDPAPHIQKFVEKYAPVKEGL